MKQHQTDTPLVIWPCYEPAGHRIVLTESDLVQHVLLLGSTGSGKSTLLTSATDQLIGFEAHSEQHKSGLLILDAKGDDIITRVQAAARPAGRSGDVTVFGAAGDHAFDLFGPLRSLEEVDRLTRLMMLNGEKSVGDNAYWHHATRAMISAAFALLVASKRGHSFASIVEFMRCWFLSPVPPPMLQELVDKLKASRRKAHPLLAAALDQVQLWSVLDGRTRSNLQSCLLNVLRPLLSPVAVRCFDPGARPVGNPVQTAVAGRICIVSVNALAEPELARFFFQLAKQAFFETIQQRSGNADRFCGLIADEFPLVVTREDAEQLATVRSKRCFVLAAAQGLHSLSERVGLGPTRVLLNNFNTTVFLRSREVETAVHAHLALGSRIEKPRSQPSPEWGGLGVLPLPPNPTPIEIPICPLGALGRLDVHQAFAVFANGTRTEFPIWFAPWFETVGETKPAANTGDYFAAAYIEGLMEREGFSVKWSGEVVMEAAKLCQPLPSDALRRAQDFFRSKACRVPEGLESLPPSWLAGLPGILWRMKKPHWTKLPFFIDRVALSEGLLLISFAQEEFNSDDRVTAWDRIRRTVNASLYPSRWRSLRRRHQFELARLRPELRSVLGNSGPELA